MRQFAHGVNVKLAKSGGIREAVRMVHAARALGLGCMLGCMVESGLGIAAGAHIASLFDHVDLDGNLLIAHDPWPGVEFLDGVQTPAELARARRRACGVVTRYLILAEGFSADVHYGKTMRGVLRYRRDDVVAILDSTRAAGETEEGVPIVATVDDALRFEPDTALVGVATQGGRFPTGVDGASCAAASSTGSTSRTGFTSSSPTIPSCESSRQPRRPAARPAPAAGRSVDCDRREPRRARHGRADRRIGLRNREDDRCARARPRSATARPRLDLRAHRADGDRDRRLGDRRRCGRRRLHRRRGGTARRSRGPSAWQTGGTVACCGSRARARSSIPSTPA